MKATIIISGGIQSQNQLENLLIEKTEMSYNDHYHKVMCYNSVKDAKEAIKKAYSQLKIDDPNDTFLYKSTDNKLLTYDAGKARIEKQQWQEI
jgi:hypothetical protein